MKKHSLFSTLALGIASVFSSLPVAAAPTVIYDSLGPVVPSLPSAAFQAQSTREFGDRIQFGAGSRDLSSVTVRMVTWAYQSEWAALTDPNGWTHPLTFNIYGAGSGGQPGTLLATQTSNTLIPWRPEPGTGGCTGTTWRPGTEGPCFNGFAFDAVFDFSALNVTLPEEVVFGIAYNTQSHGYNPVGAAGPFNSLNVGLTPTAAALPVGTDSDAADYFRNTSFAGFLGTHTLNQFTGGTGGTWATYRPAVQFVAESSQIPTPATLGLVALALLAAGGVNRRSSRAV